ncbi:MAG: hypothetical protein JSR83_05595 [Proteobacteria bacterium]|nr:hypothetical protein [Pseudomonadota bacterium]
MKLLHELASQVLLGSGRRPPDLPEPPGNIGALLKAACPQGEDMEVRVLRCAGSLALCSAAGYVPPVAEGAPPPLCPEERLALVDDPQLLSALPQILVNGPDTLRREAFFRLASKSYCLAPSLLPHALTLGQENHELRPALLPVIGQRGQWLAGLNPEWAYAAGEAAPASDLALWENGSQDQRKHLLGRLRQSDPGQARSLLQDGFSQLDARERASLLETMSAGLGLPDEDFLESLLADRSREVRQRAANLLATLPDSRFSRRMTERMAACLGQAPLPGSVFPLEAPAGFSSDWKSDALEENRAKNESLGERAWWLYQIARCVPLAWWTKTTGLSPGDLIEWAHSTDWSEAILRAWYDALLRNPEADWAAEFVTQTDDSGLRIDLFKVLAFLPAPAREQHWLRLLEGTSQGRSRSGLLAQLVNDFARYQEELSESFSHRILVEIKRLVELPVNAAGGLYEISQALPELASLIPPACFAAASEGWPVSRPEIEYFSKTLARLLAIVEQRKTLHQILR